MKCFICKKELKGNLGLSKHLSNSHKDISAEQYVVKYKYNGKRPTCLCGCGQYTKFTSGNGFDFAKFVRGHKNDEVKRKIEKNRKKTCLEKYGTSCSLQNENVKEKAIKTNLKKYGVDHFSKSSLFVEKTRKTCLERYGTNHFNQSEYAQNNKRNLLEWNKIIEYCNKKNYTPLFSEEEYRGNRTKLKFKCNKHDVIFESKMVYVQKNIGVQCPTCKTNGISFQEKDLVKFIKSILNLKIEENIKSIIPPYELDIYIPDKNIAIEYNGLYWHSELKKPNNYHFDKYKLCKQNNIKLIQIFEDEWRDKQSICQSIIKSNLNLIENKINARDLIVDNNPKLKEIKKFIDDNHLQGYCKCKKKFVLRDKVGNILFSVTLRKPFIKKYKQDSIEIARICSKSNYIVRGGFSKLMKQVIEWAKNEGYKKIISYSDCRYSNGKVYSNFGFQYLGHTRIGYDYTDFENRFGRFQFRAQNGKTQKEIAKENKIYKIFNAGNDIWEYLL